MYIINYGLLFFVQKSSQHENPHGRKKVSTAQNLCSSPDAIMSNPNKINRQSCHQSGSVRSGYMKISMWSLVQYLEISY